MTKELTEKPPDSGQKAPSFFDPPPDLETLAQMQGVKPFDFDELLAMDERWPEDESVDEFIAALRAWRKEGKERRRP